MADRGPNIVSIPRQAHEAHMSEHLRAANAYLNGADVQDIDTAFIKFPVFEDRMGKERMSQIEYTI